MTWFLDFDRTIFDTDRFIRYVHTNHFRSHGLGEGAIGKIWNEQVESGKLKFFPGELTSFLYQDALKFFKRYPGKCVIMTYDNLALQKAKIKSSFFEVIMPEPEVLYTLQQRKGHFLENILKRFTMPYRFVDDSVDELSLVGESGMGVEIYEMRRDGKVGGIDYPTLKSFDDLP